MEGHRIWIHLRLPQHQHRRMEFIGMRDLFRGLLRVRFSLVDEGREYRDMWREIRREEVAAAGEAAASAARAGMSGGHGVTQGHLQGHLHPFDDGLRKKRRGDEDEDGDGDGRRGRREGL